MLIIKISRNYQLIFWYRDSALYQKSSTSPCWFADSVLCDLIFSSTVDLTFLWWFLAVCSMAMSTQVQVQISKKDTVFLGGNMALQKGLGGGSATVLVKRQISPISAIDLLSMVGLRSLLSLQTSRSVSLHLLKEVQKFMLPPVWLR